MVCRLGQVAQKHRYGGDVLPGLRKLQGAAGIHNDDLLDLKGMRLRAARNVTSIRLRVASGVH
jgi:hypothetical protein